VQQSSTQCRPWSNGETLATVVDGSVDERPRTMGLKPRLWLATDATGRGQIVIPGAEPGRFDVEGPHPTGRARASAREPDLP
jgi:hypothetical protein